MLHRIVDGVFTGYKLTRYSGNRNRGDIFVKTREVANSYFFSFFFNLYFLSNKITRDTHKHTKHTSLHVTSRTQVKSLQETIKIILQNTK